MRSLSLLALSAVALAPSVLARMQAQAHTIRAPAHNFEPRGGAGVVGISDSLPSGREVAESSVESVSQSPVPHAGHNKRLIEARSLIAPYLQRKREKRATCKAKKASKKTAPSSKSNSDSSPAAASPKAEAPKKNGKPAVVAAAVHKAGSHKSSESGQDHFDNASSSPSSGTSSSLKGLIGFSSDNCGSSKATASTPNGAESWLNCGISGGGWTPPTGVTVDKLAVVSIEEALAKNSVWEPCRQYTNLFEKYADANNLPPILLMAIALQESTCNSASSGDSGGAHGLMQITTDKCDGQGSSACASPDYNIRTAAKYLRTVIDDANGNILTALGAYNGWFTGMTTGDATKAASSGCCECQQNLDYLFQLFNGWLLGKTGYEMGSIGNLDVCHNQS